MGAVLDANQEWTLSHQGGWGPDLPGRRGATSFGSCYGGGPLPGTTMFKTVFGKMLDRLEAIEKRLGAIEASHAAALQQAQERELALREQLEGKRRELEALGAQGLHVVEQLDIARQRIRELEGKG